MLGLLFFKVFQRTESVYYFFKKKNRTKLILSCNYQMGLLNLYINLTNIMES